MLHFLALVKHSRVHKQELYHNINIIFSDSLNWCHFDPIAIYIGCVLNLIFIRRFLHGEQQSIKHCFSTSLIANASMGGVCVDIKMVPF